MKNDMADKIAEGSGFFAALDQSGGSTPSALRTYGISELSFGSESEIYRLIHEMRTRIMTAPAFRSDRIIAAILFAATMDGEVLGKPTGTFLWEDRGIVPFLKVDAGLEAEADGVQMMKPIAKLESTLARAVVRGIFGTKMRSTIRLASPTGIAAIVAQQARMAARIAAQGLLPILEPEVLITSPDKADAEAILLRELLKLADNFSSDSQIIVKLTLPEKANHYEPLVQHNRVARVLALSGGYDRNDACNRLALNDGIIASFSRALISELRCGMDEATFNATLARAIDQIFSASIVKHSFRAD